MSWLWGTAVVNLGLGGIIWLVNTFGEADSRAEEATALAWQVVGSNMFGFGVLVLMLSFATSAITATLENSHSDVRSIQASVYKLEKAMEVMSKSVEKKGESK